MNDIKKRKAHNINSPNDINLISPLSALESRKVLYFQKINSVHDTNTFGSQPVVVYKKTSKNNFNPKSPTNQASKNTKSKNDINKYISEEKIGKKLQKFNSFSNIPPHHHHPNKNMKIKKTKSCSGNIVSIEQDKKLKEEKERKKNINEQKLFSKTVRESNMRPIFPKNKNRQLNLTKNCFSIRLINNENEKYNLNKEKLKEKENSKEQEIDKSKIMNQLVENAVAIEIKKYQNKKVKNTIEEIKNAKKRECLEENGITTSTEEITENEKNDEINNETMNEKSKKRSLNSTMPKTNNFISPEDITHTHSNSNMPPLPKTKNKPYIGQFEFLQKIKEEKKKLISAPRKSNSFSKNMNDNYNNYYYSANPSSNMISPQITDSFRKKYKNTWEEKRKLLNDKNNYTLEDKKNHRSAREISEYLKEKKIKNKQIEESKQLEKNKKLFLRFKNLYNLNMKDYNDLAKTANSHKARTQIPTSSNNQRQKKLKNNYVKNNQFEERKDDKINSDINANTNKNINNKIAYPISNKYYSYNTYVNNNKTNNQNNNNNTNTNNIRKKKEINEYYIGNDSTLRNNNSTMVDANEYFLNVLESQQLLVNSRLKKIENETDTNKIINIQENIDIENTGTANNNNEVNSNEINELKNNLIINELNVSKEQIKKIIDREKAGNSNSKKSVEILNTSSVEELKQKINATLKRANLFFSKDVMENYKQNILNNLTDNSNSNSNNNNNNSGKKSNRNRNIDNNYSNNNTNTNNKSNDKEPKLEKESIKKEKQNAKKEEHKCEDVKIDNFLNNEDIKPKLSETKIETVKNNNNSINKKIQNELNINNINDASEENMENNENIKVENLETENADEQNSKDYSNNLTPKNNNKKSEITIEPRAVVNLVEIIKFIIQRKIFVILYESYINHAIFQQYNIAFSFFVAICKQYPFKKLEEYYNYKTYNYAFRQLFRPFNRKNFKYFLECFNMKKKVEYLVALLTKMIKFKTMERIFIYGQYFHEDDEEKAFKLIIMKIMHTLIRPHLYEAFINLKNNLYQNMSNIDNNKEENKDDSEVNFNISDDDDNMNVNNYYNFKNQINNENENGNKIENDIEKSDNSNLNINENANNIKSKESSIENSNSRENINNNFNYKINDNDNDNNINVKINENENDNNELNISDNRNENSIMNHRRKNDSSLKMNSFLYESLDSEEKSSISVEPNSVDNDKLHKLKMLLIAKNKNYENCVDDNDINYENEIDNENIDLNYEINNNSHSSKKSEEKSLNDLINMQIDKNINKTLSDMMEENSLHKSGSQNTLDNFQKNLGSQISLNSKNKDNENENENNNNKNNLKSKSNDSINSIGFKNKNEEKKEEEIKVNNDTNANTKDTKEITGDSNTINMNTNNKNDSINNANNNNNINEKNSIIKQNNIIKIEESKSIECEENNIKEEQIEINNKLNNENKDSNKDNDFNNNDNIIELEYKMPRNNLKSQLLKNYKIIDKNDDKNAEIKKSGDLSEERKDNEKELLLKPKVKIPLIKIINDSNDSTSENKNSKDETKQKNKFSNIFENKKKFSDDLVNEIVNKIIFSEIKSSKIKLLPNKKYKFDKFLKKSNNNNNSSQSQNNSLANSCNSAGNFRDSHQSGSSLNQLSLHEDTFSLNDSLNSNYSVYSVFNKTIKDKKKEHSLSLYFKKICPKLISYLHKEIIKKYPRIYENISLQKKNVSENLMISLMLQDAQMLRNNYKKICYKENLEKIIDKKEILKNFASINRKIRQEDNITSDNYYDNMLNECVLETAIELIEKERFYGDNGEPLKWSSRTREITFKYEKSDAKKFADYICKNILTIIHNRIGLINDNYSYMNQDEINYEREKRLLDTIKSDLNGNESQWKNLEMEETQLKVESTEMILDQLYNEVIEILEHIQYNRVSPELYQFKSIYACEEIPKLSFQQTTTEDVAIPEGDENDFMNI